MTGVLTMTARYEETASPRKSGAEDYDDDRDDEHESENEAPSREASDQTEAPEEFAIDDEDSLDHPEDDGDAATEDE
jgi:hypothetical protein